MKCPNDKNEMVHGFLGLGYWEELSKNQLWLGINWPFTKRLKVIAYRCPKCKKIEIVSE